MKCITITSVLAVAMLATAPVQASEILLKSTTGSASATDEGLGDSCLLTVGCVTYAGGVGTDFIVDVTTGTTKPILGGPGTAELDLSSLNVRKASGSAGVLTLTYFDQGFLDPNGAALATAAIGGTLPVGATGNFEAWINLSNLAPAFAGDIPLGSIILQNYSATTPPLSFSNDVMTALMLSNLPYSLGVNEVVNFQASGTAATYSSDYNLSLQAAEVPEPASLLLLGSGLVVVARKVIRKKVVLAKAIA